MNHAIPAWVGWIAVAAVTGGALWKGESQTRQTALVFVAEDAISSLILDHRWPPVQWGEFGLDVVFLAYLVAVSLRTHRFWPLVAASFALLAVLTHVGKMLDGAIPQWAYISFGVMWAWGILFSIAAGVIGDAVRRRRGGSDTADQPAGAQAVAGVTRR